MSEAGIWAIDPSSKEKIFIKYSELETDVKKKLLKPIGGFVFPAGAFIALPLPEVPFYIKDLLPMRGKIEIFAPPKTGKSFLCLQIARCIAAGEPLLGLQTKQGRVLYVQFELGEEVLQNRMLSTGKEYDDVYVGTAFDMKLDSEAGRKKLLRAVDAVEPKVLILDPFYKAISGDENEAIDVLDILDFLDSDIIEAYGCSVIIIHHSGKDESKRGRGSSVLEDWVDSYISMKRTTRDNEDLKIKLKPVFLRHAPLWDEGITADFRNYEFVQVAADLSVKLQVENYVKKNGVSRDVTVKEIFAVGIGSNT